MIGIFKGLKKLSLIEFPGKVCAIGFTGGCNFRCPWCYVRDLVLNYDSLPDIKGRQILRFLESRKRWIDAFVVSGGEPTIHDWLPTMLAKVKDKGFLTGLETNGSNPKMLSQIINDGLIDYVEMDVKAPLTKPSLYMKSIGMEKGIDRAKLLEAIGTSIRILKKGKVNYAFRTTVVPTLIKDTDVVEIAKELRGAKKYYLQQFKPMDSLIDKKFSKLRPYSSRQLINIRDKCRKYVTDVEIRGL